MAQIIDVATLKSRLDAGEALTLLNVLPEDAFEASRLPGSLNACVYEVVFPERVRELVPEKKTPLVVYGQGARFHASERAAERLEGMGYHRVYDFRDGLEGWQAKGLPIEGVGKVARVEVPDGTFAIDPKQCLIAWEGSNLASRHYGKIGVTFGSVTIKDGKLTAAECVADMREIVCDDIQSPEMNATLIAHLKSDDFFDVSQFPDARFRLTAFQYNEETHPGERNATVAGELMLRGVTQPIEFPATVGIGDAGLVLQSALEVDRTRWNVYYGSGKIFEWLGKHLVNDMISLRLKMLAPLR